jgi:hypothetical protein
MDVVINGTERHERHLLALLLVADDEAIEALAEKVLETLGE